MNKSEFIEAGAWSIEMDYNQYIIDYDNIIRYGRAPTDDIYHMAGNGAEHGQFDVTNTHDAILGDYLQDHDDPRHIIVQRDLQYRTPIKDLTPQQYFFQNLDKHGNELGGTKNNIRGRVESYNLPDDTRLEVADMHDLSKAGFDGRIPIVMSNSEPTSHKIKWTIPDITHNGRNNSYVAAITPHELNHILSEFGIQHPPNKIE